MEFYTEAHPIGRPDLSALVVVPPNANTMERRQAFEQAEDRAKAKRVAAGVAGVLVFTCHEGIPDPSLLFTEKEQAKHFPPEPQYSVRIHGSH